MQPPRPPTRLERVTSHESACSQATPAPQRGSYTGHVISEASAPPSSLTHALGASYVVKARRPVFAAELCAAPRDTLARAIGRYILLQVSVGP
jgi:hypothetical protein